MDVWIISAFIFLYLLSVYVHFVHRQVFMAVYGRQWAVVFSFHHVVLWIKLKSSCLAAAPVFSSHLARLILFYLLWIMIRTFVQFLWGWMPSLECVLGVELLGHKVSMFLTFCLFFVFWDLVSLFSPGCPTTTSLDQAGLKLTEIRFLLPPECCN